MPPGRHQAHDLLSTLVLEGTAVDPLAAGQGQVDDIADPHPISLSGLRLVEQQIGSAAFAVGRIGGAWRKGLSLQGLAAVAAQSGAQRLPAHAVTQLAQLGLQPARAVAPLVVVKHVDQRRFPGGLRLYHGALAPGVVAAGYDLQNLAEQLHRIVNTLLVNKL